MPAYNITTDAEQTTMMSTLTCKILVIGWLVALSVIAGGHSGAAADTVAEYQANLRTCLSGEYRMLCNHSILNSGDAQRVREAEYQANLRTCLSGEYRMLCNHSILNPGDAQGVREAEYQANLRTCLSGEYRMLCNHSILNPGDAQGVREAEYQANLRTCRHYPALCNHALLTPKDRVSVSEAEESVAPRIIEDRVWVPEPEISVIPRILLPGCAENGSCFGDISETTGRQKTIRVKGYFRKDGTYVRGHYRSAPRR